MAGSSQGPVHITNMPHLGWSHYMGGFPEPCMPFGCTEGQPAAAGLPSSCTYSQLTSSSRACPSGLVSLLKTLTATSLPASFAAATSPDAPSPRLRPSSRSVICIRYSSMMVAGQMCLCVLCEGCAAAKSHHLQGPVRQLKPQDIQMHRLPLLLKTELVLQQVCAWQLLRRFWEVMQHWLPRQGPADPK